MGCATLKIVPGRRALCQRTRIFGCGETSLAFSVCGARTGAYRLRFSFEIVRKVGLCRGAVVVSGRRLAPASDQKLAERLHVATQNRQAEVSVEPLLGAVATTL